MFDILSLKGLDDDKARQIAPLALAFVGDTVFDLYVRTHFVISGGGGAGALHRKSSAVVNARSQAVFAHSIETLLNEDEKNIYMRGRNAKSGTIPKNMSVADYRYATAAEALVGYLYLTGRMERLKELLSHLEL